MGIFAQVNAATSFTDPELLAIGFEKLREWVRQEPRLAIYAPPRNGDVRDSLADTSAACEAMGYKTLVEFKEGLRQTVNWYRQEARIASAPAPAVV